MSKINIKPLFDNVLIKPVEAEVKTASGIILPDSAKEKPQIGEIVAVGPGRVNPQGQLELVTVKVGQKVLYRKWGGDEAKVGDQEFIVVKQGDILAVVESDDTIFDEARSAYDKIKKNNK